MRLTRMTALRFTRSQKTLSSIDGYRRVVNPVGKNREFIGPIVTRFDPNLLGLSPTITARRTVHQPKEVLMFAAMLEVNPKPEQFDAYLGMAKMLRPELEKIDGFIDNARYASLTREGWLLSLSSWRDEKSLIRWRTEQKHHKTMQAARDRVFSDYRLRIGQVVSDTQLPAGHVLLEQRLDVTETGQGTAVTLHEGHLSPEWVKSSSPEEVAKALGVDTGAPDLVYWDVFDALMTPGDVIAVVTWRDHAAAEVFQSRAAKADHLRERNIRIVREYGMFDRREAPQYFAEVQRSQ
jgi:heme-degrading monooxygenase HmoA